MARETENYMAGIDPYEPITVLAIQKDHGCNIFAIDDRNYCALDYAAQRNHSAEVVELLIEWGCQHKN